MTDTQVPPTYAQITPLDPEALWFGKVYFGNVTGIVGNGGIGKGFLVADLVSRVTRGAEMPDGTPGPDAGSVILVTTEDDPNMAESYRLQAVGADLTKVHDMTTMRDGGQFSLPASIPALREAIYAIGDVRMVVIDPLADVSEVSLSTGTVTIRKKITNPLIRLARDTGVAIVLMMHTTKDGKTVQGSAGIVQALRSLLSVTRDAINPAVRVLQVTKSNIADDSTLTQVRYTLTGKGRGTHVEYLSAESDSAEDVVWHDYTDEEIKDGWSRDNDIRDGWTRDAGQGAILDALKFAYPQSMRAGDLATDTDISYIATRVLLSKLAKHGDVVEDHGDWRITVKDVGEEP